MQPWIFPPSASLEPFYLLVIHGILLVGCLQDQTCSARILNMRIILSPCIPWNTSWSSRILNIGTIFVSLYSMEYILFIQDPKHWNYFISLHSVEYILFIQDPKHRNYFISLHSVKVEYILFIKDPKHWNYFISLHSVEYILFILDLNIETILSPYIPWI